MRESNFRIIVFVFAVLFVTFFSSATSYAKDINLDHKGKVVVYARDMDTETDLGGAMVNLFQLAVMNESFEYVSVDSSIDLSAGADALLVTAKTLDLGKTTKFSDTGMASFENLDLGVYLLEIPDQTLNNKIYGSNPFIIEMPVFKNGNYSYLIEATPKISIHNDPNDNPIPLTSSQSSIWMWLLISIGLVFLLYGVATEIHGKKKKH